MGVRQRQTIIQPQRLQVSGDPALYPSFDPWVTDYVSRCKKAGDLRLSIAVPQGQTVSPGWRRQR